MTTKSTVILAIAGSLLTGSLAGIVTAKKSLSTTSPTQALTNADVVKVERQVDRRVKRFQAEYRVKNPCGFILSSQLCYSDLYTVTSGLTISATNSMKSGFYVYTKGGPNSVMAVLKASTVDQLVRDTASYKDITRKAGQTFMTDEDAFHKLFDTYNDLYVAAVIEEKVLALTKTNVDSNDLTNQVSQNRMGFSGAQVNMATAAKALRRFYAYHYGADTLATGLDGLNTSIDKNAYREALLGTLPALASGPKK